MVADVDASADLRLGAPRPLFRSTFDLRLPPPRNRDVLPDGRFVLVGHVDDIPAVSAIHVMVNPFEDFKPARR